MASVASGPARRHKPKRSEDGGHRVAGTAAADQEGAAVAASHLTAFCCRRRVIDDSFMATYLCAIHVVLFIHNFLVVFFIT